MAKIPIWQFGNRWEALRDYLFHPKEGRIPRPVESTPKERRSDSGADLVLVTLIPANAAVYIFLLRKIDKYSPLTDIIYDSGDFSIVCYLVINLLYSLYLATYYRMIWNPYYSLYEDWNNDRRYFLLYAVFFSGFGIVSMLMLPGLWPLHGVILFIPLMFKKLGTQRLFCEAVDDYLNHTNISGDVDQLVSSGEANAQPIWVQQLISARQLSISFATNFIFWGALFGVLAGVSLAFAYAYPTLGTDWRVGTHQLVSMGLFAIVGVFYVFKTAGGGIKRIRRQLEKGEWEGFSLFRKFWA